MLPDRVSNPGPLTYESGALPMWLHYGAGRHFARGKIIVDSCRGQYDSSKVQ